MRSERRILFPLIAGALLACSSSPAGKPGPDGAAAPGAAGTGGLAGESGATGATGGAGGTTSAVTDGGAGASGGGGVAAGGDAAAGSSGGESGTSDAGQGDQGGQGGAGFWGPNGPKKQFTCPPGPFGAQVLGTSTDICTGFKLAGNWNEGPTWIAGENAFFFSNYNIGTYQGGDIIKYTIGGDCEVWLQGVGCNGLGVSPSGNLLGACQGPRAVMEYDVKTKVGRMVATMANGKMLDSPNDLIARSDGNVYFSNRTAELGNRPVGLGEALVRIDPMGVTSVIQMGGLNGVALSPDETKLYVVGMGTWTLDAAGVPGQKGGPTPGGDGIAVDCAGRITNNGTNSAYGGPDGKTLLVVGGGTKMRTVAVSVPGLP